MNRLNVQCHISDRYMNTCKNLAKSPCENYNLIHLKISREWYRQTADERKNIDPSHA